MATKAPKIIKKKNETVAEQSKDVIFTQVEGSGKRNQVYSQKGCE